jgi:hypothetical protein
LYCLWLTKPNTATEATNLPTTTMTINSSIVPNTACPPSHPWASSNHTECCEVTRGDISSCEGRVSSSAHLCCTSCVGGECTDGKMEANQTNPTEADKHSDLGFRMNYHPNIKILDVRTFV